MRAPSGNTLPALDVAQRAGETRSAGKVGAPHLWLQRRKPGETVLIHHGRHHLERRKEA